MNGNEWFRVTLREWVENQRTELTPHRARLMSAIDAGDVAAIRELMGEAPFDQGQRRYLDDLLRRWEEATAEIEG